MDLTDVQKEMVPGAKAAMLRGLSLDEAREAFTLTLIETTYQENGCSPVIAARRLGVTPGLISQARSGKTYSRFRSKKKTPEQQ